MRIKLDMGVAKEERRLDIEAFVDGAWVPLGYMLFDSDYCKCSLTYDMAYLKCYFALDDNHAISINYPPVGYTYNFKSPPKFIDDLIPSGASRRYWVQRFDLSELSVHQKNYILLKYATISPIGNLRVRNSVDMVAEHEDKKPLFDVDEVISMSSDFLDYANERGGVAGGATGAGGEAPKFIVRRGVDNKVWIDPFQSGGFRDDDGYYLVKFPRGKRTSIDRDILISEYYFYHELSSMGESTIDVSKMVLEFNSYNGEPSLWLPRFDVQNDNGCVHRYSMQSVYSILEKGPGSYVMHEDAIGEIISKIERSEMYLRNESMFDFSEFVADWICRDMLNMAFGNADNHGRNTSFLLFDNKIKLSPIYDFAPMKADPESIARTIKWRGAFESGTEISYDLIIKEMCNELDCVDLDFVMNRVNCLAVKLLGLYERLKCRGVPESILNFPSIGFSTLDARLKKWGVL